MMNNVTGRLVALRFLAAACSIIADNMQGFSLKLPAPSEWHLQPPYSIELAVFYAPAFL
jgi:hypothetical protein